MQYLYTMLGVTVLGFSQIMQTLMNARLPHITVNRTATTLQDHIAALAKVATNYWLMANVKVSIGIDV